MSQCEVYSGYASDQTRLFEAYSGYAYDQLPHSVSCILVMPVTNHITVRDIFWLDQCTAVTNHVTVWSVGGGFWLQVWKTVSFILCPNMSLYCVILQKQGFNTVHTVKCKIELCCCANKINRSSFYAFKSLNILVVATLGEINYICFGWSNDIATRKWTNQPKQTKPAKLSNYHQKL